MTQHHVNSEQPKKFPYPAICLLCAMEVEHTEDECNAEVERTMAQTLADFEALAAERAEQSAPLAAPTPEQAEEEYRWYVERFGEPCRPQVLDEEAADHLQSIMNERVA